MWRIPKWKLSNFRRELVLFVAYPLFAIVMVFLWICPFSIRKKLNTIAGKIYYKYGHKARATALDNIAKAYNDLSQTEVEDMAKAVFNNVASAFLDFFSFVYVNNKKHYFKYIEVEGEENLRRAYDKGKGVICLIPHISSWELSAVTPPMLGYPTVAASKPPKRRQVPYIDDRPRYFGEELLCRFLRQENIHPSGCLTPCARYRRRNSTYGYQAIRRKEI